MEDQWYPPVPPGYSNAHRAFLQGFMARGTMTFSEGQKMLAEILSVDALEDGRPPVDPRSVRLEDFQEYIRAAREAIGPVDLEIRNIRQQTGRGERIWAFINAQSDPATQMATTHTPEEVAYIKRLLDAMFEEYNTPRMEVMAVDEGQALKVSRPKRQGGRESGINGQLNGDDGGGGDGEEGASKAVDRGLKHSEVLSLLSSLVAEGWLDKSRDGFYSLSARSLMELQPWLMLTYNDNGDDDDAGRWQHIKVCEACKEIVTYGQRCANRDCIVRLHDVCEEAFWRTRRERKCPKCKTAWDGKHYVGERAVTSRSGFQNGRGRRSGGGRRSDLADSIAAQEEAGNEEGDEDVEV